jgi:hypothetical protein
MAKVPNPALREAILENPFLGNQSVFDVESCHLTELSLFDDDRRSTGTTDPLVRALCAGGALRPLALRQHRCMVYLLGSGLTTLQPIVLAVAGHEHPIPEHLHLWQDVFQEVYSDAVAEPTLYRWRDECVAGGEAALSNGSGKQGAHLRDRRIAELEQQIEKRNQVIGEYTIANRILKKLSGQSV